MTPSLFSMKLMDSFVEYNYSLHDIPARHKGSLCRTHHLFGDNVKPICPHLCEDLKANIKNTNWSILLDFCHILSLRN
jgi:hypothetical protein